jgi:hypothetical protein
VSPLPFILSAAPKWSCLTAGAGGPQFVFWKRILKRINSRNNMVYYLLATLIILQRPF